MLPCNSYQILYSRKIARNYIENNSGGEKERERERERERRVVKSLATAHVTYRHPCVRDLRVNGEGGLLVSLAARRGVGGIRDGAAERVQVRGGGVQR